MSNEISGLLNDLLYGVLSQSVEDTYGALNQIVTRRPARFRGVEIPITRLMPDAIKANEWDKMADNAMRLHHLTMIEDLENNLEDIMLFENNIEILEEIEQTLCYGA